MKLSVTQVIPSVTRQYPYTHRVEFGKDLRDVNAIEDWIIENDIDGLVIANAVYLNPENTSLFVLTWS